MIFRPNEYMEKEQNKDNFFDEAHFAQFYPEAKLTPISYEELHDRAREYFEGSSRKFILPENYLPKNFSALHMLTHPDGRVTYIAEQTKTYSGEESSTEELAYFVDYDGDQPVGHGELRNNISDPSEYFHAKPFVGFSRTYEGFERQGLGRKRLEEMNAFARARFGHPLNSDTLLVSDSLDAGDSAPRRIWEKLAEEDKAESYAEGEHVRYRMK